LSDLDVGQDGGFGIMSGQIACQSSSLQTVNCGLAFLPEAMV